MTTCEDRRKQETAVKMEAQVKRLFEEYFLTKMADYLERQHTISQEQGRLFDSGHMQAFALHMFEAGMEIGSLFQAFGVSVNVGDTPRDGTDETLFYCDPDGPKRCLVDGDEPTWLNEEYESEFCKIVISTMQVFLKPNKGTIAHVLQPAKEDE